MDEKVFARLRDWVEPAHPGVVRLYDDLVSIYRLIRDKYQAGIDKAFDEVSRQVGFVVATTIPMTLEVDEKGKVKSIGMGADYLKDTLFDKALTAALSRLTKQEPHPDPWKAGTYKIYVLWFDALKLKLRTDWMEPAHFIRQELEAIGGQRVPPVRPEVMEPAHWFDPGRVLPVEEAVLISVIDEVYPELRLVDRLAYYRQALRARVRPEVMEPAHFPGLTHTPREELQDLLRRIRRILDEEA